MTEDDANVVVRFLHADGQTDCALKDVSRCATIVDLLESTTLQQDFKGCSRSQLLSSQSDADMRILDVDLPQFSGSAVEALIRYGRYRGNQRPSLQHVDNFGDQFAQELFAHDVQRSLFKETLLLGEHMAFELLVHDLSLYAANLFRELSLSDVRYMFAIENDLSEQEVTQLCEQNDWLVSSDDDHSE